jgi:hypothetical protein
MRSDLVPADRRQTGLVDVLDRVLDKGLVVAGDIRVSLAEVELLTIRIRLIICSLDKAQEIGLDWWKYDRYFSTGMLNNGDAKKLAAPRVRTQTQARGRKRRAPVTARSSRRPRG